MSITSPTLDADEAEWHAWRRNGITASDIARASTGKYGGSPMTVVGEKLGLIAGQTVTEDMQRGHDLEPTVTAIAATMTGDHIGHTQAWVQHAELGWPRATIDGVTLPAADAEISEMTGVCEIKTRRVGIPRPANYYLAQTHWQMWVCDTDTATIAEGVLDPDGQLLSVNVDRINRDDRYLAGLIDLGEILWSWVERGEVPPPTVAADLDAARELHAAADLDAEIVDLTDRLSLLERRAELVRVVDVAKDELDTITAIIVDDLGAATKGEAPGWRITRSAPARQLTADGERQLLATRPDLGVVVLDKKRAKAEAGDLYDAARSPVGARKLTITSTTRRTS